MKTLKLIFAILFITSAATAQQYTMYVHGHDTDFVQVREAGDLEIAMGLPFVLIPHLQVGYSPVNNLSLAVAADYSPFEGAGYGQHSVSVSAGTYFKLKNKKANDRAVKNESSSSKRKQSFIINARAGYSSRSMVVEGEDTYRGGLGSYRTEMAYQGFFINSGLEINYKYGHFISNFSFRRVSYSKVFFDGNGYENSRINTMIRELENSNTYNLFGFGLHSRLGKKRIKFLMGGYFPIRHFHKFGKSTALYLSHTSVYIGFVVKFITRSDRGK